MPLHPFPQPLTALRYSRAMQVPLFEPYRWGRTEDWTVARAFVMADRGVGMRGRSAAAPRLSRSNVKRCIKHLSTTLPCATNPPLRSSRRSRRRAEWPGWRDSRALPPPLTPFALVPLPSSSPSPPRAPPPPPTLTVLTLTPPTPTAPTPPVALDRLGRPRRYSHLK